MVDIEFSKHTARARQVLQAQDLVELTERFRRNIGRFDDDSARLPSGAGAISNYLLCRAVADAEKSDPIETIRWIDWRLALEYALLEHRIRSSQRVAKRDSATPTVSLRLWLSFGLALTDRRELARSVLQDVTPYFSSAVKLINADRTSFEVFDRFFDEMGTSDHTPPQFADTPITIETAVKSLNAYANRSDDSAAILDSPGQWVVPVQLIYLATCLPDENCTEWLKDAAEQVRTTQYPEDKDFQDFDIELSIHGL